MSDQTLGAYNIFDLREMAQKKFGVEILDKTPS